MINLVGHWYIEARENFFGFIFAVNEYLFVKVYTAHASCLMQGGNTTK